MDVSQVTLEQIYADIVNSSQWKLPWPVGPHPSDKAKVLKRRAGQPASLPSGRLARSAWRVAALLTPLTQPPPPPPTFVKVAPITVTRQGSSDQRVCLRNPDGSLRPGVFRRTTGELAGTYGDESGAVYNSDGDGLEDSGVRTKLPEGAFGLVKAKEMDNRSACECPTAGDPSNNTGSWTV